MQALNHWHHALQTQSEAPHNLNNPDNLDKSNDPNDPSENNPHSNTNSKSYEAIITSLALHTDPDECARYACTEPISLSQLSTP